MRLPGFCGGTYQSQSPNIDAEDCINLYPERSESQGAKVPIALLHTPGKKLFCQLPEAGVPGMFTVNGRSFAAGASLWELQATGFAINRGSLGAAPILPTQICSNEGQILILNNGNLFVLTLATNAFVAVNMAQFNGPVSQIGSADGYFLATIQNSHTFQQSKLADGTVWSGLDIATVSLFPDNFTSMICDHREVWFFSGKKCQPYYNSGAGFPVFIPIQGAMIENGAGATFATVQLDNSLFWIDQDERGSMVARKAAGYVGQRVSTHAVELAWQQYKNPSLAVGYSYQEEGHSFWVIRFPGEQFTWVYDVSVNLWHKRAAFNQVSGLYESDHSQSHTFNFGKHLVGDWASGNIYEQSNSILTDNGGVIRRLRRSPTMAKDNQYIYFPDFELDVEVGLPPVPPLLDGNSQPRPAQVMLRWSDNGAKTWSTTYFLNCGVTGEFNARARKTQLGRARRRVWEVSMTDPVPWRIADAYVRATPSTLARSA